MNALINSMSGSPLTMTSQEIADLVGKRHDNVKRTIETLSEGGVIVRPQIEDEQSVDAIGRTRVTQVYVFSGERGKRDSYVVVGQLCPEFLAAVVDRWQQLEKERPFAGLPNFMDPVASARAWADAKEEAKTAEDRALEAERTKAEIGSRREATAMATASHAKQRARVLEIQLDRSNDYATVKRMEAAFPGRKFNWSPLKKASIRMGLLPINVPDVNYGEVNAYHANVWQDVYQIEVPAIGRAA